MLIDITIPVYNEQNVIKKNVEILRNFLLENFPYDWQITIANNASTDCTWEKSKELQELYPDVKALHLDQRGKGVALRHAWTQSEADIVAYMDADLSTDLTHFLPLIEPLVNGRESIAIGSRLAKKARVNRQLKREVLSRGFNLLIKTWFFHGFTDANCGFKAARKEVTDRLLPLTTSNGWFFDTELLLLAERNGLAIYEIPVNWVEDTDSRVRIIKAVFENLTGLWRMRLSFWRGAGFIPIHCETPATTHQSAVSRSYEIA